MRNGFGSKRIIPIVDGQIFEAVPAGHSGALHDSCSMFEPEVWLLIRSVLFLVAIFCRRVH